MKTLTDALNLKILLPFTLSQEPLENVFHQNKRGNYSKRKTQDPGSRREASPSMTSVQWAEKATCSDLKGSRRNVS